MARDLINSCADDTEDLHTVDQLTALLDRHHFSGTRRRTADELGRVQALRPRLRAVWDTGSLDDRARLINELLRDSGARPYLSDHDGTDWHLHVVDRDEPVDRRLLAETAMALADLVRLGETDRLSECASPTCTAVFVDLSRNRSKRYCDTGNCANREHVHAYRRRQRQQAG